jgi:sulfite exporter TauE/SafE
MELIKKVVAYPFAVVGITLLTFGLIVKYGLENTITTLEVLNKQLSKFNKPVKKTTTCRRSKAS